MTRSLSPFLLAGHTNLLDWCFGLAKQKLRRYCWQPSDLAEAINSSARPNTTELVGLEDGTVLVPTHDWVEFLGTHFRKIPQLRNTTTIFSRTGQGKVTLKGV